MGEEMIALMYLQTWLFASSHRKCLRCYDINNLHDLCRQFPELILFVKDRLFCSVHIVKLNQKYDDENDSSKGELI